jgi:hypothetical protein
VEHQFPQLIEQVKQEDGVLIYEDEATCKVSGSISRTWQLSGKGNGIEVKFKGCGDSAKIFGAISVEEKPCFYYAMDEVFNNVWRLTRRKSTHNRYFANLKELKETLVRCFCCFEENPGLLSGIIAPYLKEIIGL